MRIRGPSRRCERRTPSSTEVARFIVFRPGLCPPALVAKLMPRRPMALHGGGGRFTRLIWMSSFATLNPSHGLPPNASRALGRAMPITWAGRGIDERARPRLAGNRAIAVSTGGRAALSTPSSSSHTVIQTRRSFGNPNQINSSNPKAQPRACWEWHWALQSSRQHQLQHDPQPQFATEQNHKSTSTSSLNDHHEEPNSPPPTTTTWRPKDERAGPMRTHNAFPSCPTQSRHAVLQQASWQPVPAITSSHGITASAPLKQFTRAPCRHIK